jgi:hypothetical protein
MSAGLPLIIISILAIVILAAWVHGGVGNRSKRVLLSSLVVLLLTSSWAVLLLFGIFHPVGSWGMAFGFIISIAAFFVPMLYSRLHRNENT